jgi:nucleoside-diphosphate-sugar epimerase
MLNANNSSLSLVVTAATSSLGRETTRQLARRGHRITGLTDGSAGAAQVRQDGGLPAYSDPLRAGELKSIIRMAGADVVVHLLPQEINYFPHKGLDGAQLSRRIADSTKALVEAVQDTSAKFIVFLSNTSVYGDTHGEWVDESARTGGNAVAKAAAQSENPVLHGGVPACVLRAGTVYGANDPGMRTLGEAVRRGRSVYLGNAHSHHNWIHEVDLARAIVMAAEQQPAGQVFNIVDDNPASPTEFAGFVASSLGMPKPAPLSVPTFALGRMTSEAQRILLDSSARAKNDKAKETLGWSPRYPGFQTGIEQALMIWRAEEATP